MTPAVSVVIVNFNAGEHLARCLDSLVEHLGSLSWEAVVVDNRSSDGSERVVQRFAPRVALVRSAENVGFGRAVNIGARETKGPGLFLLNPDGRLLPGAAERLCAELAAHPECAIVGPAVVNDDGSMQGSARGDPDLFTGFFGRSSWLTRRFPNAALARRNVVLDEGARAGGAGMEVDWVSGSCMLVRRDVFAAIGGFDERFFMYWEDADLCRRARAAGWRVRYRPDARVAHSVGRSSQTVPFLAIRAFHRSAYLYYATHVAPSAWNPLRWFAFALLRVRCWWQLARAWRERRRASVTP